MKDVYPPPLGNVHLSILQTVESRTPLLLSVYLWDKYSFEKSINANKVGIERGYSFEKYTFKKNEIVYMSTVIMQLSYPESASPLITTLFISYLVAFHFGGF